MSTRFWTLSGLVAGALVGVVIMVATVALVPNPQPSAGTAPTAATPSSSPGGAAETPAVTPGEPPSSAGSTASAVPRATTTIMHIGEQAPVLALPQVGGGFIDLATLRGRPVWILFVSSACSECATDLGLMADYVRRYSGDDLLGIVVDLGESEAAAAAYARRNGITLPIGLDLDGHARDEWDVLAIPAHVWVDRLQVIRAAAPTSIGTEKMAQNLALILPGVTVTP